MTAQIIDLNANKEAYVAAIEERIESLITDLDLVSYDSYDDYAIQTRLDDLSRLHSDIIMRRNPDRSLVLLEERIARIEEHHQPDPDLAKQRIADLSYLKVVLLGQDD